MREKNEPCNMKAFVVDISEEKKILIAAIRSLLEIRINEPIPTADIAYKTKLPLDKLEIKEVPAVFVDYPDNDRIRILITDEDNVSRLHREEEKKKMALITVYINEKKLTAKGDIAVKEEKLEEWKRLRKTK